MGYPTQPKCEECREKNWRYLIAGDTPDGFFEIAVCEDCLPKFRPQWNGYIWDVHDGVFIGERPDTSKRAPLLAGNRDEQP